MSTFVNKVMIEPDCTGEYSVWILRGRMAMGNDLDIQFECIGSKLSIQDAVMVARGAPFISQINFYEYAPAKERPAAPSSLPLAEA